MLKHSKESCLGSFPHATFRTRMPHSAEGDPLPAQDELSTGPSASAQPGNALNLCSRAADASAQTDPADEWGRQGDRHGARRASGARVRGNRSDSTAGGLLPPPRLDQATVRDALEALHDNFPLDARMDQAGSASGDDAAPSPLDRLEAGHRGWSGRVPQRRGSAAATRADGNGSAPEAAWHGARMRAFVNGGGVAAQFARLSAGAALEEPAQGEMLTVSDHAVFALFGRDQAALLRVIGLQMQV
jgi:hypothetical protein